MLLLVLVACTPGKPEPQIQTAAKHEPAPSAAPPPALAFEPADPAAPLTGRATAPSFDADGEPPPLWFNKPVCNSRYARVETLHLQLPKSLDIDIERLHALREFSTHTLVWTPEAAQHLVEAPAAGTRSQVRWRLDPDAPLTVWVVDANPAPEHAEACWDAIRISATIELESADGSFAITRRVQLIQLTATSTWVKIDGKVEDFGLGFSPSTIALNPRLELTIDLPVARPRRSIPAHEDARGMTPIEVQLAVTIDTSMELDGELRRFRGVDRFAISEQSPEARALLGGPSL